MRRSRPSPARGSIRRRSLPFVKRELGSVKTPKAVHVFETMPKSAVGKVLKTSVREEILKR